VKTARLWSVRHAHILVRFYGLFRDIAPKLRRAALWIGPRRAERWVAPLERAAKEFFFDCRMCGGCTLSATGMACPMNCPKHHRNGPCGGVGASGQCEVDPAMRCVWLEALDGARRIGDQSKWQEIHAPTDNLRHGKSSWMRMVLVDELPSAPVALPAAVDSTSALELACRSGNFVVTAELSPPDSVDPGDMLERAAHFRGLVDGINVTDGAGGNCHMSSIAAATLLSRDGYEPVFQIACRDRNRIAIQADILGASALGLKNLLAITGDGVGNGDHPEALPVFDLDSVSLLQIARGLRDRGTFASGRALTTKPRMFLGATINPFAPPYAERVVNFEKKINAGAQFVQTQYCFDLTMFEAFMREVRSRDLHHRCHIIVGVGPILSARTARWMIAHVPGVHVPEGTIARLERAQDPKAEGVRICVEIIQALRGIEGVAGVHVMAHRREALVPRILLESGLRDRNGIKISAPGVT
jgi:methylenetetrahydrofolate reductase (NADPH)